MATAVSNNAYADDGAGDDDASPAPIYRVQTGLVASDSLTDGDPSGWQFTGSAVEMNPNAPHAGFEDATGMHIGVLGPQQNTWAGYFAITPFVPAQLFHARITLPDASPTSGVVAPGVYIQQEMIQDPRINAIGCGAEMYPTATHWTVSLQSGDEQFIIVNDIIYRNSSSGQPASRDCTLVTDGDGLLTAYLDGEKVFSSANMTVHQNMPNPFEYYLEIQTNSATPPAGEELFTATFTDYYATTSDSVKVMNAGAGSSVRVVDATSGETLASAIAGSDGVAFVNIAKYHMPLNAHVMVYDATGANILASTGAPLGIYGGDTFNIGDSTLQQAALNIVSVNESGDPVPGLFATIVEGTVPAAAGFTPLTYLGTRDTPYIVTVYDDGTNVFDRWEDGNKYSGRVVIPTEPDVTLTATFASVDGSMPPSPTSLTATSSYTTNDNTPTIVGSSQAGLSIQLYDGQTPIGSPATASPSQTIAGGAWLITSPALPDGLHLISARATDGSGNTSLPSRDIAMTIDTVLPSISIAENAISPDGRVSLIGAASDSGTGIRAVEVATGAAPPIYKAATPGEVGEWSSWTFTTDPLAAGVTHTLTARATDAAGNQRSASIDVMIPFVAPPGHAVVTVNALDESGDSISGLYTTLELNGVLAETDFTPSAFTVSDGQEYVISVSDYGSNYFDHWQDSSSGSTSRARALTTSGSPVSLTAVYRNTPLPPPPAGQSAITVTSVDSSGNPVTGLYTTLSHGGSVVGIGFTPSAFTVDDGSAYVISVGDYGSHYFDHWQDSGSTARERMVTAAGAPLDIVAVYRNTPLPPPPAGQSVVTVSSEDMSGNPVTGLFTAIELNDSPAGTGFTPSAFMFDDGVTYEVTVSNYGSHYFDHWQDSSSGSSTSSTRAVTTSGSAVHLVAVYRNTPLPPPPAGQSVLTIDSINASGDPVTGLYTTLSHGGSVVGADFTPGAFMLDDGLAYTVSVSDYASNYFDHWQDTGDTSRHRTVTASGSPVGLVAVYRNTPLPPPPTGQSALTVTSVDSSGNAIAGLYTTLSRDGSLVSTDFTQAAFMLDDGQQYVVAVSNYGQFVFSHWQDSGSTSNSRAVTTSGSPADLVAIYNIVGP